LTLLGIYVAVSVDDKTCFQIRQQLSDTAALPVRVVEA
jgi:hypothetical protein